MDCDLLLNAVENYARLRGKGKPEIERLMDLHRVKFAIEERLGFEQLFGDNSEKLVIKEIIKEFTYKMSRNNDRILFPSQGDSILSLSETDLYKSLQSFEETFMQWCLSNLASEDKNECMMKIKIIWQSVLKSQSISVQEKGGESAISQGQPESLGHSSYASESSGKKFKGNSSSEKKKGKKSQEDSEVHGYRAHKTDSLIQYWKHQDFLTANYEEINSQFQKRTLEFKRKPECILTYRRRSEKGKKPKKIEYILFPHKQEALKWAYDEIEAIEKFVCIEEASDKTDNPVMVADLKGISTKIIRPFTQVEVHKGKSFFDSGADVASFPYDDQKMEKMIRSAISINGRMEPIVYGELTIRGEKLPKIYELCVQNGGTCSIGLPQLQDMGEARANGVIHQMRDEINSRRKPEEKVTEIHRL